MSAQGSDRFGVEVRGDLLLGPLVLPTNLVLLLGSEVVLDIEGLADFFGGFALDHVGDGLAADVEQGFDVEVVGCLEVYRDLISSRGAKSGVGGEWALQE